MIPKNARLRTRMLINGQCLYGHPASVDTVSWTKEGFPQCLACRRVTHHQRAHVKKEPPRPASLDHSALVHEMIDVARRLETCRADERAELQARYDMLQGLKDRLDSESRARHWGSW